MTKQELAKSVKDKYPEYANIDDNELADKIIAKYPVYQNQITEQPEEKPKSVLQKVGDFFTGSTQKFAKTLGTAASVVDPKTKKLREETLASTNKMVDDLMSRAKSEPDKEKAKKILESASKLADTEGIDIFNNPEYKKTTKQIVGEAIGTGLEALSFGTYGKTAGVASKLPTVLKPVVSPAKKVLTGITEGAKIGATFGGVSGLSQSLQENKGLGDIAKETALGAVGGGLLGGTIGGVTSGSAALINKGAELTKNYKAKLGKVAEQKLYNTATDLVKMSPTAIQKETKFGKNTPKFIVDEGILPLIEGEGNKINTEKAVDALNMRYTEESNSFNSILRDSGEYVSLNELRDSSLENIKNLKTKGSDYQDAIKHINSEIESYKSNYKDTGLIQGDDVLLPLEDFNKIKSGLWSKTNFNATQKDALLSNLNYKMGSTARDIIENKLSDTNAKAMNSRLGDFINSIKVLENANGKTLPGGFIGKQFTRIAGTIAGSGGGVTGSIIGNMTGGKLAEIFSNPQLKTNVLYKVYNKLYKTESGKTIIEEAQKILEKRGLERASRKLLEAPKSIPLKSKSDTSRLFTQEEAQQLLESMKIKEPQKLLKAPLGDKTNPILLQSPKGKGEILKSTQYKSALEALRSPEMKAKLKAAEAQMPKKVTKTSNNLYHSTSAENLDSIIKGGLKTGQKPRFEGVSSPNKISFSANEEAAKYYGGDVMIRTKTSYKPTDLELDLLAGGNGTYLTGKNIPPEMLEIKVGGKWTPLTEYKKPLLKANNLNPLNFKTAEDYVKAQGTPVYHGTAGKFDKFDDKMTGSVTGAKSAHGATWFTDDKDVARAYSIYAAESGPINKLQRQADELDKIARKSGKESDWEKYDKVVEEIEKLDTYDANFKRRELANVKEAVLDGDFYKVDAKGKSPQELSADGDIDSWLSLQVKKAKDLKKDGLIIENIDDAVGLYDKPSTHYAIFNTSKIKTKSQLISEWNKSQPLKSSSLKNSLVQEAKKYNTTVNIQDKNDLEYLGRILSEDNIKDIKAGKLTNWRGEKYSDVARVNFISETPKTISQQLKGKIKPVKLKDNTLYHGTSPDVVDSIFSQGFKKGSELPEDAFRSGGYGSLQNSISLTTSPKTAEIFSGSGQNVSVIKTKLADNAKIVKIEGIQDAVDLEDYISYLTKNKIDAVWIGGGEKELVVLNSKKLIPISSETKSVYKGK